MANVIELKDGTGTKAYPITKAEAVYYDEDYYVDGKIQALEVEAKTSGTVMPIYIGDYIISADYLPSSLLKIGNYFYVFNAPSTSYALANKTDLGKLRVFDIVNNVEVTASAKDLKMGHANSVCYNPDEGAIFLVPIHTYTSGTSVNISKIYKYSLDFSTTTEITTPTVPLAIAYDFITGSMYYREYKTGYDDIYKYSSGTWTLYTTIHREDIPSYVINGTSRVFNQDFAVRDNIFYVSAPHGNILYGELTEGSAKPAGEYIVSNVDAGYQYRIGELEGFEFDEDGHLYASQYTNLTSMCTNGFVTELPIHKSFPTSSSGVLFGVHTGTATYLGTDNTIFANNEAYVRSVNQLRAKILKSNSLRVLSNTVVKEEFPVIVDESISIDLQGELQTKQFSVQRGTLTLSGNDTNCKITALDPSNALISCESRSVGVRIVGQYAINVDLNGSTLSSSNFIAIGYSYAHIIIRNRPVRTDTSGLLYIGSSPVIAYSEYIGNKNIAYVNDPSITIHNSSCYAGFITNSSKEVRFYIPYIRAFYASGVTTASITAGSVIIRGPEGYIVNPLDLTNTAYTVTTTVMNEGLSVIIKFPSAISPPANSVFTSYNNIPVSVAISANITVSLSYA